MLLTRYKQTKRPLLSIPHWSLSEHPHGSSISLSHLQHIHQPYASPAVINTTFQEQIQKTSVHHFARSFKNLKFRSICTIWLRTWACETILGKHISNVTSYEFTNLLTSDVTFRWTSKQLRLIPPAPTSRRICEKLQILVKSENVSSDIKPCDHKYSALELKSVLKSNKGFPSWNKFKIFFSTKINK